MRKWRLREGREFEQGHMTLKQVLQPKSPPALALHDTATKELVCTALFHVRRQVVREGLNCIIKKRSLKY